LKLPPFGFKKQGNISAIREYIQMHSHPFKQIQLKLTEKCLFYLFLFLKINKFLQLRGLCAHAHLFS